MRRFKGRQVGCPGDGGVEDESFRGHLLIEWRVACFACGVWWLRCGWGTAGGREQSRPSNIFTGCAQAGYTHLLNAVAFTGRS